MLQDAAGIFRKCGVTFYLDDIQPYHSALASTRMRCYDIMTYLNGRQVRAELYKPFKKYAVAVFSKTRSDRAVKAARRLRAQGVKIIFDSYCEYLTDDTKRNREKENILKILKVADTVITPSRVQRDMYASLHPDVFDIPESVEASLFLQRKRHLKKDKVTLVYCGYAVKARDVLYIKEVLRELTGSGKCELLLICERDPGLKELPYRFLKYDQKRIADLLLEGDIMIAPRAMEKEENKSHSFSKVAYPLAVGLPAVASPMPSYIGSPVILCQNQQEWRETLAGLIAEEGKRQEIGDAGREYVREHYSIEAVGGRYLELILRAWGERKI